LTDSLGERGPLELFAARLGVGGLDTGLLAHALRHRSWCAENLGAPSNERLEFLGDAVLGLVITDHLYTTHPEMQEGELAKVRAAVVSAAALAEVARTLDLGAALELGRGEESSGGRDKSSILADAMEAVFAAVYLSGGLALARDLILRLLEAPVAEAVQRPGDDDFKTRLQELAARRFDQVPQYTVQAEGPDHAKEFEAVVEVARPGAEPVVGRGRGRSKKQAEQAAARSVWQSLLADTPAADTPASAERARDDRRTHA
jgi:ribonuclease-3